MTNLLDNTPPEAPRANASHTQREAWLKDAESVMATWIAIEGHAYPANVRVSCGWPKGRGKAIGQCWSSASSGDNHFEIFVSPAIEEPVKACYILLHEMVHATLGIEEGHGKNFSRLCAQLGFEGKATANYAGAELAELIQSKVVDAIGPYPHSTLNGGDMVGGPKKSKTYLVKSECEECGYIAYTTAKWIEGVGSPHCPDHGAMHSA